MSIILSQREVLLYLNELGYQNITAQQLKEFIRDLKKLMKYEAKQHYRSTQDIYSNCTQQHERHTPSHCAPTEASKAKQTERKEKIVSIKIKRPSCARRIFNAPLNKPDINIESNETSYESYKHFPSTQSVQTTTTLNAPPEPSASSLTSPKRPRSCGPDYPKSNIKFNKNSLQPKASYILPRAPTKMCKSDPVALYQKYQEEWKKRKLPGEDNHSQLRWAIRERMLGEPKIGMSAAPSMEVIARKRQQQHTTPF